MTRHLTEDAFEALLRGQASKEVERHLAECALCAQEWQDVARAHAFMLGGRVIQAPEDLYARVLAALEDAPAPQAGWWPVRGRALLALALSALLLLAGGGMVGLVVLVLSGMAWAPVVRVLVDVLQACARFGLHFLDVLLVIARAMLASPWMGPMLLVAVLLALLATWTTRFYSRRLFA